MKNLKKIALILMCLILGMVTLSSCSLLGGDPTGTWYMTGVKNDDSGEMQDALDMCESMGVRIVCKITNNRVDISLEGYESLMSFNYRQQGNRLIDTADDTEVSFRISGDTLTLIFSDCDMIFTREK